MSGARMSLKMRLLVPIVTLTVVIFSIMTFFTASRARELVINESRQRLEEESLKSGADIQRELELSLAVPLNLAYQVNEEIAKGLADRNRLVHFLRVSVEQNKKLLGAWLGAKVNGYDERDAEFVGKEFHDKTGRFYPWYARVGSEIKYSVLGQDAVLDDQTYYTVPLVRGKPTILEPYVDQVDKVPTTMTSLVVPFSNKKEVGGVIGADISLSLLQKIVSDIKPFPGSSTFLISSDGNFVSHADSKLLTKRAEFTLFNSEIQEALKSGKAFNGDGKDTDNKRYFINAVPIPIGATGQTWMLLLKTPANEVLVAVEQLTRMMILSSILGLIAIIISVMLIGRSISNNLKDISTELAESSSNVTEAIEQLSIAGLSLSQSSSSSAASLEETVASLEELTSMVRMNSDNAKQAAVLSASSSDSAVSGEKEMQNLVEAMHEISQASRKIEEIINVIDDIAFQTNLLALNASVEAARAGEHGKGFAVVADAVRTLAQRSASAAKDITVLIRDSVERIDKGTQRADKSGDILKTIVTSIKKVADLNTEISVASEEQSHGIGQISKAMNQLDSAVQSNAASSEEIASTAEEIRSQARTMNQATLELNVVVSGGVVAVQEQVVAGE